MLFQKCCAGIAVVMSKRQMFVPMLLVSILLGCSGTPSDQPVTGEVEGIVTLDGNPLANARVIFVPQEGGQASDAVTDDSGRYVLRYKRDIMGAKIGQHTVTVTTFEAQELDDFGKPTGGRPELVPAQYNENSTLVVEVKKGKNDIPLPLTK